MTSSSTTSASLIPLIPSPSDPSLSPPPPEDSSSFGQVMQQHSDSSSSANAQNQTPAANHAGSHPEPASTDANPDGSTANPENNADNTPATPQPAPMKGGGGGHGKKTQQPPASNTSTASAPSGTLKSMLIRASVLANATTATPAAASVKTATTDQDATSSESESADLSALIAQALGLSANTKPAVPAPKAKTDAGKDTTPTTQSHTTAPDLSTLMAQALILAANAQAGAAGAGKNVASATTRHAITGASTKEKKSASDTSKGSFLQSGTAGATSASDLLGSLGLAAMGNPQAASGQTLAANTDPKKSAGDLLAKVSATTAGTANVERQQTMNADQNLPALLNGTGATTGPQQTISDMQITLSSNHNFENALKTVLHVASLNEVSQSGSATRVAIELQTPPGAIVNVYVTKSNDQWRAQLSTNDPVALSWVQDKVTSLKQTTDAGVEVKWLPPQLDTTAASAGGDANLGWDRGGQGQSPYQRDENNQPGQPDDESDLATAGANFMDTLTASGRSS